MKGASVGVALLLALGTGARPAVAQIDPYAEEEPAWKQKITRDLLYKEGKSLVQQGFWAEAVLKFKAAGEIQTDPRLLLWMAYAEEQQGHLLKARLIYATALAMARSSKLFVEERDANTALKALDKKLPRIVVQVPKSVSDASIFLDDSKVEPVPDGYAVDPGQHDVRVTANGREPYRMRVIGKLGESQIVNVVLPPSKDATDPAKQPGLDGPAKKQKDDDSSANTAMVSMGAVLAAAGGTLLAVGVTREPDEPARIPLLVSGGGLGVSGLLFLAIGLAYLPSKSHSAPPTSNSRRQAPFVRVVASPLLGGGWIGATGEF